MQYQYFSLGIKLFNVQVGLNAESQKKRSYKKRQEKGDIK